MRNRYELHSLWRFRIGSEALWDALETLVNGEDPMIWWPAVTTEDYADGSLHIRAASGLGYSLRFRLHDLDVRRPDSLTIRSDGDLHGSGLVAVEATGPDSCTMSIAWSVETSRRWMRVSAWLLRPAFVLAHHLVMAQGEKHFNRWLATTVTG